MRSMSGVWCASFARIQPGQSWVVLALLPSGAGRQEPSDAPPCFSKQSSPKQQATASSVYFVVMSYLYSLPTTGSVAFAAHLTDPTGNHAHSGDLARATSARNAVRSMLKETRRTDAGSKDWMGCATVSHIRNAA